MGLGPETRHHRADNENTPPGDAQEGRSQVQSPAGKQRGGRSPRTAVLKCGCAPQSPGELPEKYRRLGLIPRFRLDCSGMWPEWQEF